VQAPAGKIPLVAPGDMVNRVSFGHSVTVSR
jgi:hypothetical protein